MFLFCRAEPSVEKLIDNLVAVVDDEEDEGHGGQGEECGDACQGGEDVHFFGVLVVSHGGVAAYSTVRSRILHQRPLRRFSPPAHIQHILLVMARGVSEGFLHELVEQHAYVKEFFAGFFGVGDVDEDADLGVVPGA